MGCSRVGRRQGSARRLSASVNDFEPAALECVVCAASVAHPIRIVHCEAVRSERRSANARWRASTAMFFLAVLARPARAPASSTKQKHAVTAREANRCAEARGASRTCLRESGLPLVRTPHSPWGPKSPAQQEAAAKGPAPTQPGWLLPHPQCWRARRCSMLPEVLEMRPAVQPTLATWLDRAASVQRW